MRALLVGAGRMGQRHLAGLASHASEVTVVDPSPVALAACAAATDLRLRQHVQLDEVDGSAKFDLAIIATTAHRRLETVEWALPRTAALLLEKPLEQSRERVRRLLEVVKGSGVPAWANHYRRSLAGYRPLAAAEGPFVITVSSGAMGIGCNGIHWIDFALHLTGQQSGRLLHGEIEDAVIGSGRGASYRDYGGWGVFGFPDGSRLMLSSNATSSAPTAVSIVARNRHWIVDQQTDTAILHERPAEVAHATYLYGKDYATTRAEGLEDASLPALTGQFAKALLAGAEPPQPRLAAVAPAYEMLFDLLETSGRNSFDFT
jgi:predicted dehydrogenase